LNLRFLKF